MKIKEGTLEYPEEILISLKEDEKHFLKEVKILAAVKLYELNRLSLGKAAKLAGVDKVDFIKVLGEHKVSIFKLTKEELAKDIENA
jgi:predicted HTH domain antitoxin